MNENIDLTKILRDCPKRWKLYSTIYGDVEFIEVSGDPPILLYERDDEWDYERIKNHKYPIKLMSCSGEYSVSREGKYRYNVGECTLFPSKDQRDWNKFSAPWYKKEKFDPKTLNAFDKVLVRDIGSEYWYCGFFSHIVVFDDVYRFNIGGVLYVMCIPYNDETKHLVGAKEEAPEYYRYWED